MSTVWRLLFDPWSFRDTRRLANPEVSDGDVTLGWPWDSADRVFGPYAMSKCLDPFRFLLISLAGWMNQQWPTSPA